MLSRIAESLFWIGRYVERAEDTARILEVQTQMMVEDPGRRQVRTVGVLFGRPTAPARMARPYHMGDVS